MRSILKTTPNLSSRGFTAMELALVLAISAIMALLAAPAFRDYSLDQRMKAAIAKLHTDLTLARNEAVSRNARVIACPQAVEGDCADHAEWQHGWLVFSDTDDDREWQTGEPVLRRTGATTGMQIGSSVHRNRLRFFPGGSAPGSNASIRFCDARGADHARGIALSASGRIRQLERGSVAGCPA